MPRGEKLNCDLGRKWQILLIHHLTGTKEYFLALTPDLDWCREKVLLRELFLHPAKTSGSSMQRCLPGNSNNIPASV